MSYKDKDKQREAVRLATRRYRERKQGITSPASVIPKSVIPDRVRSYLNSPSVAKELNRLAEPWPGELTKARQVGRG